MTYVIAKKLSEFVYVPASTEAPHLIVKVLERLGERKMVLHCKNPRRWPSLRETIEELSGYSEWALHNDDEVTTVFLQKMDIDDGEITFYCECKVHVDKDAVIKELGLENVLNNKVQTQSLPVKRLHLIIDEDI